MGMTRVEEIRYSKGIEEYSPDVRNRMKELGIIPASPTLLRGGSPVDYCVVDGGKLESITSDGAHRRCTVCTRAYYFVSKPK